MSPSPEFALYYMAYLAAAFSGVKIDASRKISTCNKMLKRIHTFINLIRASLVSF